MDEPRSFIYVRSTDRWITSLCLDCGYMAGDTLWRPESRPKWLVRLLEKNGKDTERKIDGLGIFLFPGNSCCR